MAGTSRVLIAAAVGGLMVLGTPSLSRAQRVSEVTAEPVTRLASFPPGSIRGLVLDEKSNPVPGAVVSAIGASTVSAVTDRTGRFELRTLPPGPYLLRARLAGFVTPPAEIIQVRSSARAQASIALRHVGATPVLAAGFGDVPDAAPAVEPAPGDDSAGSDAAATPPDQGETAWRIRHMRRSILKDITLPDSVIAGDDGPTPSDFAPGAFANRSLSGRLVTNFLTNTPFSGQVNLLTAGSFDAPQQLFSSDMMPKSTANVSLSAPVGQRADWTVRGALTQSDIAAWIVAGSYTTRAPARHLYDMGLSYSMQRYDGGNPLALRSVTDGSRNVGEIYAFDTFTVTPVLAVSYGSRYARYDYLDNPGLLSPRVALEVTPAEHLRLTAAVSRREQAPGAEEFLPPGDEGIWLPPQRTFSSFDQNQPLHGERTTQELLGVARDLGVSTIEFHAFRQRTNDQVATLFGAEGPDQPVAKLGHYLVTNVGDARANGYAASFRTAVSTWLHGSVEYSLTNAALGSPSAVSYLILAAPSVIRPTIEHIHNVSTTLETKLPETATRVLVLYRISNGFARPGTADAASSRPAVDSRFDVQIRQSLPFMKFTSAKWEMLFAVRNFFHETDADQSVYDELLVVNPPKRIVGGLTMRF